jgi:hypothetical protein
MPGLAEAIHAFHLFTVTHEGMGLVVRNLLVISTRESDGAIPGHLSLLVIVAHRSSISETSLICQHLRRRIHEWFLSRDFFLEATGNIDNTQRIKWQHF